MIDNNTSLAKPKRSNVLRRAYLTFKGLVEGFCVRTMNILNKRQRRPNIYRVSCYKRGVYLLLRT